MITKKQITRLIKEEIQGVEPDVLSYIPSQDFDFPVVPYPDEMTPEGVSDLADVITQYNNRKVPEQLQEACDIGMDTMFESYLDSKGKTYNTRYLTNVRLDLIPFISELKEFYNRPRPGTVAQDLGIDFSPDVLETAQSPAYPSGHTIQAYVIALLLGDQFPEHIDDLIAIAELISQSRIDRGVHFPTDIEYGKTIAAVIYLGMRDKNT